MITINPDSTDIHYVDEKKVSSITGIAIGTLRNQRFKGEGIPYYKRGRSVKYRLDEVYQYMEGCRIEIDGRKDK